MSNPQTAKLPVWFWFAAGGALIWNLIGVMTYLLDVTMSSEAVAKLPQAQQQLREATPAFVTGAYAFSVFTASMGSLMLLLRRAWATPLFVVSFFAILIQFGHMFLFANAIMLTGATAMILPSFIIIISLLLIRFSLSAKRKNWLI